MTGRVRVMEPPPHVALHPDHAVQSPTRQLIGHGCVLHAGLSLRAGQRSPPFAGFCVMVRVRVMVPVPQLAVQALYPVHALT